MTQRTRKRITLGVLIIPNLIWLGGAIFYGWSSWPTGIVVAVLQFGWVFFDVHAARREDRQRRQEQPYR